MQMKIKSIPILLHPNFTKIAAILIGYSIWLFASNFTWVSKEISIPICFYQNTDRQIQALESVFIKIAGPRNQMYHLKLSELAMHVDISDLKDGDHEIILNPVNLFLPETLKLIELIPAAISCNISTR